MQLVFLTIAREELAEAKRFYNRQQQGLGNAFQREAEAAARQVRERPLAWQVEIDPVRRFIIRPLPLQNALHRA